MDGYDHFVRHLAEDEPLGEHRSDLVRSLSVLPGTVRAHWRTPHLSWYPDHGPEHSRTVVGRIFEMLPGELLPYGERDHSFQLSPWELYLLCAAAWLHDIGMQNVKECSPNAVLGQLTPEDYRNVRARHPEVGASMIFNDIDGPHNLGLTDDVVAALVIGLLVKAHGTKQFGKTLPSFAKVGQPFGKPVRGPLLAALLLMADEFDVHSSRARFEDDARLSPISLAHNLKHHYTAGLSFRRLDGRVRAQLELCFPGPPRTSAADEQAIQRWITRKLRQQMSLTAVAIRQGFHGRLEFDRHIEVRVSHDIEAVGQVVHRVMDPGAGAYARAQVHRGAVLDHDELLTEIELAFANDERLVVAELREPHAAELEAIAYWFAAHAEAFGKQVLVLDDVFGATRAVDATIDRIAAMLGQTGVAYELPAEGLSGQTYADSAGDWPRVVVIAGIAGLTVEQRGRLVRSVLTILPKDCGCYVFSSHLGVEADVWHVIRAQPISTSELDHQLGSVISEIHVISAFSEMGLSYPQTARGLRNMEAGLDVESPPEAAAG